MTQILIGIKRDQMIRASAVEQPSLEAELESLQAQMTSQEEKVLRLNERVQTEIDSHFESSWTETLTQASLAFATNKLAFFQASHQQLIEARLANH